MGLSPRDKRSRLGVGPSPGMVPACGDASLFPPGTVWEDAAQERDASMASEPRQVRRSFLDPRRFVVGKESSSRRAHSAASRMPRMKRCRLKRPSHEINDAASEAGGSEAGSVASSGYSGVRGRRASLNNQLGWLMRQESEAAFLERRAPGQSGGDAAGSGDDPPPRPDDIPLSSLRSALDSPTNEGGDGLFSPLSHAVTELTEQESLISPNSEQETLFSLGLVPDEQDEQPQAAGQGTHGEEALFDPDAQPPPPPSGATSGALDQTDTGVELFGHAAPPPPPRPSASSSVPELLRDNSALDEAQLAEGASVQDVRLAIARNTNMLRI